MQPETVTFNEVLDEGWKLWFAVTKGILLAIAIGANFLAMFCFFVAQRMFYGSARARRFVEAWVPVRPPTVFDLSK